jgi:NarL family two-component system response regulator LiaR
MATRSGSLDKLTPREMDVLRLLAQGLSNRKIAAQLSINERTVKYHVSAILAKLEAANRTEAVMRAIEQGLITLEEG